MRCGAPLLADGKKGKKLKHRLEDVFARYREDFSGTCLIQKGDEVLLSAASGLANRDFEVPNRMDTKFDTASVTKAFTAVAVLMLIERGALRLSDAIGDILDLRGTSIPKDVTIESLLNHTSGIADDADEEAGEDYAALFVDKPNYSIRNCADFLPQFAYKPPLFQAGTDVRYNNCAFILLGLAIEKLTGMDYRSFVAQHVFSPAGMKSACFGAKDEVCPNAAEGYFAARDEKGQFIQWKKNIYSYPPIGTADGGAFCTAQDLCVFIQALRSGALLSVEFTDRMLAPHCAFTRRKKFGTWRTGYAFEFIESDGSTFCMYKEGVNAGVDAVMAYYPALNITLCMLSNQEGSFWSMYNEMQAIFFERFQSV